MPVKAYYDDDIRYIKYTTLDSVSNPDAVTTIQIYDETGILGDALHRFVNLQKFDCSHNPKLSGLPSELFDKCPGLREFYCCGNQMLEGLPDELFAKCPGLREFYCRDNPELSGLPDELFANCSNLQIFDCNNNQNLSGLPVELFAKCPSLRKFWCCGNPKLSGLPDKLFAKCPGLQKFYCCNNQSLSGLPGKLFAKCPSLQKFYCRDNQNLSGLPDELFAKCPGLQIFYCCHNQSLSGLPDDLFANNRNLLEFWCCINPNLSGLPDKLFAECPDLQIFDCNNNQSLSGLPAELFHRCPGLREFYCSGNPSLSGLSDELFSNNRNLLEFWCHDNPKLQKLPASLLGCTRLSRVTVLNTPLENNTPQLIRFVHRIQNRNQTKKATVYQDSQNVHNAAVHESARLSINQVISGFHSSFSAEELFEQRIFDNPHFSPKTINIVSDFLQPPNDHVHSTLLIKFSELLNAVLNFISTQPKETQTTIFGILDQEIQSSDCVCYSGRLLRLVNSINGFTPLVQINISEPEQIAYIALLSRERYSFNTQKQREHFIQEMQHRKYPEEVIQVWLEGFEQDEAEPPQQQ